MEQENLQDSNVGNLGDVLKHAVLVQLAKVFAEHIPGEKYYLDSHSYLYQSRLAATDWQVQTQELLKKSPLYQDYIDIEQPYVLKGDYLCSSGLVHKVIPDAHLILCEKNRQTREWLLQQLADNRVTYHTVKEQMLKWVGGKSFKKLPNLFALIDPFELNNELWSTANQCLHKMVDDSAPVIMLVFDYKQQPEYDWPETPDNWLQFVASISMQPFQLGVYTVPELLQRVQQQMKLLGWTTRDRN